MPEEEETPCGLDKKMSIFDKLLLIRSMCPDRTLAQARKYIEDSLGSDFLEHKSLDLDALVNETERKCPLIGLISVGSDPCGQVEALAGTKEQAYVQISMGQGQEERARKAITEAILKGNWLMLQNCHLSLEFCEEIITTMVDTDDMHRNFRLWLTSEVHNDFPIGLLQISHKFTNEPPQGLRASLKRTYANIQQDTIDYSNHPTWPSLLFAVAFLHNVVQDTM